MNKLQWDWVCVCQLTKSRKRNSIYKSWVVSFLLKWVTDWDKCTTLLCCNIVGFYFFLNFMLACWLLSARQQTEKPHFLGCLSLRFETRSETGGNSKPQFSSRLCYSFSVMMLLIQFVIFMFIFFMFSFHVSEMYRNVDDRENERETRSLSSQWRCRQQQERRKENRNSLTDQSFMCIFV